MAFGRKAPGRIKDPVCEPLWGGERVFIEVAGTKAVRMRDIEGSTVPGFDDLHDAIADSNEATELLLDGYVLPAPLHKLAETSAITDIPPAPTARQMARSVFLGGFGRNRRLDELEDLQARVFDLDPDEPAAFIAIDLLWLDGESLCDLPLQERKRLLESALRDQELVRRTVNVRPPVETWYRQWRSFGFNEIAIKDANSRYEPGGESELWTTRSIPRR